MSSASTEQATPQEVEFSQEFFDFLKVWIAYLRLQDTKPRDIAAGMIAHFQEQGIPQPGMNMDDDVAVFELLNTNPAAGEEVLFSWLCANVGTFSQESQQKFAEFCSQSQPVDESADLTEEDCANIDAQITQELAHLAAEEASAVAAEPDDPETAAEDPEPAPSSELDKQIAELEKRKQILELRKQLAALEAATPPAATPQTVASSALPSAAAAQVPRKEKKERHNPDPSKTKFKPRKTGENEVAEESEAEPEPPKKGKGKSGAGQGRKPGNRHPSKKSVKDSLLEQMRAAAERKDFDTVSKLADALKALKRVSE